MRRLRESRNRVLALHRESGGQQLPYDAGFGLAERYFSRGAFELGMAALREQHEQIGYRGRPIQPLSSTTELLLIAAAARTWVGVARLHAQLLGISNNVRFTHKNCKEFRSRPPRPCRRMNAWRHVVSYFRRAIVFPRAPMGNARPSYTSTGGWKAAIPSWCATTGSVRISIFVPPTSSAPVRCACRRNRSPPASTASREPPYPCWRPRFRRMFRGCATGC